MAKSIRDVKQNYSSWLRSLDENINGLAIEKSSDGQEYIAIYVRELTPSIGRAVPSELEGFPIRLIKIGEIYAKRTGSTSC